MQWVPQAKCLEMFRKRCCSPFDVVIPFIFGLIVLQLFLYHFLFQLTVYKGFARRRRSTASAYFSNEFIVFKVNDFSKNVDYLVESHSVTVIVEYLGYGIYTLADPFSATPECTEINHL